MKAKPLTAADRAALDDLPDSGWFDVAHAPVARPFYRCERLEAAGLLERRVVDLKIVDGLPTVRTECRRHPKPLVDWSEAPEGTTHVMRTPGSEQVVWIRIDGPADAFWRRPDAKGWRRSTEISSVLLKRRSVEPRPVSTYAE
ncbi:TPA: hypothetical protein ACLEB8_004819 [Pseudomonas aeruginosa]